MKSSALLFVVVAYLCFALAANPPAMTSSTEELRSISTKLNILGLIVVLMVAALNIWATQGLGHQVTYLHYARIISLNLIIFCLPDLLARYSPNQHKWFSGIEFYSMAVLLSLGLIGFLPWPSSGYYTYPLFVIAVSLLVFMIFTIRKDILPHIIAMAFFMFFLLLLFYSRGYHSVLYTEKTILGLAHIDQLFHSSVSNMIQATGIPSTALDGTPGLQYHWGSHLIMAGLKPLTGLPMPVLYNLAYPAIFIPFFLKSFVLFTYCLFRYKGAASFNLIVVIAIILFLYAVLHLSYFYYAQPFISESTCLSLAFAFFFVSILLKSFGKGEVLRPSFTVFTIILLCIIALIKVSTGFVLGAGATYLLLRKRRSWGLYIISLAGLVALVVISIQVIITPGGLETGVGIHHRIYKFWLLSNGFISYALGFILVGVTLSYKQILASRSKLITAYKSQQYPELELIIILSLAGLLGGLLTSSNAQNIAYFLSVQFFFSIPLILLPVHEYLIKIGIPGKWKQAFLILLIIMLSISRHDVIVYSIFKLKEIKQAQNDLSHDQKLMKSLVDKLILLDQSEEKGSMCIYIPQGEKWYYHSQSSYPAAAPFVVPAFSGIAMVKGLPVELINSGMNAYGYYCYSRMEEEKLNSGLSRAVERANQLGYKEMIIFREVQGSLSMKKIALDQA